MRKKTTKRKPAAKRQPRQRRASKPTPAAEPEEYSAPVSIPAGDVQTPAYCERDIVDTDSNGWRCSCGASGPAGRTANGMPYIDDAMLRHAPGERKTRAVSEPRHQHMHFGSTA